MDNYDQQVLPDISRMAFILFFLNVDCVDET